jgi:hypothetical protein
MVIMISATSHSKSFRLSPTKWEMIQNEKQGNSAESKKNCEKFLELWRDADPGIAEIDDTKKSLANLQKK